MTDDDFRDDPDAGVDPLTIPEDVGIEPLDPEDEDGVLEELEDEWEDEEAYVDDE